jgi:hypothetical protein
MRPCPSYARPGVFYKAAPGTEGALAGPLRRGTPAHEVHDQHDDEDDEEDEEEGSYSVIC